MKNSINTQNRHNRNCFYKYFSAEAILHILKERTLKYSSPVIFNDPFDTQTSFSYGFEWPEFMEALSAELYRLVHDNKEPLGNLDHPLFNQIKAIRNVAQNSPIKLPQDYFRKAINPIIEDKIKSVE